MSLLDIKEQNFFNVQQRHFSGGDVYRVPNRFLGLRHSHVILLGIPDNCGTAFGDRDNAAITTLRNNTFLQHGNVEEREMELNLLQARRVKFEIQVINTWMGPQYIIEYITTLLEMNDAI